MGLKRGKQINKHITCHTKFIMYNTHLLLRQIFMTSNTSSNCVIELHNIKTNISLVTQISHIKSYHSCLDTALSICLTRKLSKTNQITNVYGTIESPLTDQRYGAFNPFDQEIEYKKIKS